MPAALSVLSGLLILSLLLAAGIGALAISPGKILAILGAQLGLELPWNFAPREEAVLLAVRMPRIVVGILAGSALAAAGAALQGLFRNPLADPGLIGVSTGAALAAVSVIVLAGSLPWLTALAPKAHLLPFAAFAGGAGATVLVYRIATRGGRTDAPTMLLAGVALNAVTAAGIGALVFASTDQELRDLNFWLLGGLGGVTWDTLLPAVPLILSGVLLLPLFGRYLNAILLGEAEAGFLGFDVERSKRWVVTLAAMAAGASVALTGIIGFVGLVVPHLVRLTLGPDHRLLLPASMLLGSSLLLLADLAARMVLLPAELPIGILTSCIGGPFFLWLLLRHRASGGW